MLHQSPPRKGDDAPLPHFIHIKTARNETWEAHVAGPCQWYECHCSGRSKPCLVKVTNGALSCPLCNPLKPTEQIGYLPVYRKIDGKPGFVVLHEPQREVVDALPLHRLIVIGRESDQSDGIYVRPTLQPGAKLVTSLAWKMRPVDLTESLLRVWKISELVAWHRQQPKSDNPVSLPPGIALKPSGEPFDAMHQGAAKRFAEPEVVGPSSETFDALRKSIIEKVESRNGKRNGQHGKKD